MFLSNTNLASDPNLVAYWKLNGNSTDSSTNANNGSDTAITYNFASGLGGRQGALFDGTSSKIQVTESASLDITGSKISICGWVQNNNLTKYCIVISKRGTSGAPQYEMYWDIDTAVPKNMLNFFLNGPGNTADNISHLDTTRPHHFCSTYDGATVTIYFDGAIQTTSAKTGNITHVTAPVFMANNNQGTFSSCTLSDVAIFNRALTSGEVYALWANGPGAFGGANLGF